MQAPRLNDKVRKIIYAIIGKPANLAFKPTKEQKRINQRLNFEETTRSK